MHQIISNLENNIQLQQYIDNRNGDTKVALKSFMYTVGWYNLENEFIEIKQPAKRHVLQEGHYSFDILSEEFKQLGIELFVNYANGIVTISFNELEARLSRGLLNILGIPGWYYGRWLKSELTGTKPLDFAVVKQLYVHLEQLSTSTNFFNGNPSTVLAIVPIQDRHFGDVVTVRFDVPEYKDLINGTITELKLEVRDENNKKIDNNGQSMSLVLEFK